MLDGNSNMKHSDLKSTLEALTLKEAILAKHGTKGPSTFRRNNTNHPIDGIWTSPSIHIKAGGYFDYDEVVMNTDHRCLWINVPFESVFGHDILPAMRKAARRLHCKDPRLIDNYIKLYHQFATPLHHFQRVKGLDSNAKHSLVPACEQG